MNLKGMAKQKSKARLKYRVIGDEGFEYGKYTTQSKALKSQLELAENGVKTWLKRIPKPKTDNQKLDKACEKLWKKIKLHDAGYKCEYSPKTENLQVHHIYSRSIKHLKWDLDNGVVLNAGFHTLSSKFSAHKTPKKFEEWLEKHKGKEFMSKLQIKVALNSKPDLNMELLYLQQECKKRGI